MPRSNKYGFADQFGVGDVNVDAVTRADDDRRIFAARLGDLLAGKGFDGVEFDAFEVYAHWSDSTHGVVVTVTARRKLSSAEMGHLAQLCNHATPGRPATDVYTEWAETLETPLEYYGETVLTPENIYLDLVPMGNR